MHRFFWFGHGPWAVHVLEVDRAACWTLAAAKMGTGAAGRRPVSTIVRDRLLRDSVVGGVNGDFFLFDPPGVPVGAHVEGGAVITGPVTRPVVGVDSAGAPFIDTLSVAGWMTAPSFGAEIIGWNRLLASGLSLLDSRWGARTDTATGAVEVAVSARPRGAVMVVDTTAEGVVIPPGGAVLLARRGSPMAIRRQLAGLRAGVDSVSTAVALVPRHPLAAVGGFPVLVHDGAEVPRLDSAGGARFGPVRHPRTAVGIGEGGQRILLVVVDGRQTPYSAGMTLRELARLMLALGAEDAINLDGGGSTAMAVVEGRGRGAQVSVVNRPSDETGERAVGNALVVRRGGC